MMVVLYKNGQYAENEIYEDGQMMHFVGFYCSYIGYFRLIYCCPRKTQKADSFLNEPAFCAKK